MQEEGLAPGAALPSPRELSRRFGALRSTIRGALGRLAEDGAVDFAEGGAAHVADPAEARAKDALARHLALAGLSVEDIYQVRCRLEPELAATLAGELSAKTIADLQALIDAGERARGDGSGAAALAFHARLARECGNPLLRLLVEFMAEALGEADATPAQKPGRGYQRRLLAALIEGDAGSARRILRDHLETSQHRRAAVEEPRFIAE